MTRANPLDSLNLDEFQPKAKADAPTPRQERQSIARKVAEENGFPSRQAPETAAAPQRPRQHYFRTGRNVQINIKGSPACDAHLRRLVDELDVPKGVVLEEALRALESVKADVLAKLERDFPHRRVR